MILQLQKIELLCSILTKVGAEKAAVITILELLKLNASGSNNGGMRAVKAITSVGRAIEMEYRTSNLADQEYKMSVSRKVAGSSQMKKIVRNSIDSQEEADPEWDHATRSRVGGVLVSFLMAIAKVKVRRQTPKGTIEDYHPAFSTVCNLLVVNVLVLSRSTMKFQRIYQELHSWKRFNHNHCQCWLNQSHGIHSMEELDYTLKMH